MADNTPSSTGLSKLRSPAIESLKALLSPDPPKHRLVSFPPFKSYYRRSWTTLFAGKKRQKLDHTIPDTPRRPQLSPQARRKRYRKGVKEQVDKIWNKSFVVPQCACCPHSTRPQLCDQRTYARFKPCLSYYTAVYGSDGPQVYWAKIVKDLRKIIEQAGDARREGWQFKVMVMRQVVQRAIEKYEAAEEGQSLTFARDFPGESTFVCEVPAPERFGVDGKRAIAVRVPVRFSIADHITSEEEITSRARLINVDGRMFGLKKQHFGAEDPDGPPPRREVTPREPRGVSKLRMSTIAEEVEYPAFTGTRARWTSNNVGKMTAYDALSAYASSLAKRHGWQGVIYKQTLSALKELQPRTDLKVSRSFAHQTNAPSISTMTQIERRVQRIKALLEKMAKIYERDVKVSSDKTVGRSDIRQVIKGPRPEEGDVEWIRTIVQGILREM
ncbi:hypothetical protein EDD37DRAFT_7077 [Exophiala viscosa]|uniref:Uncharacterized protein n=1 Tax=Exophiala viscosa TaxID=2486360 RepID=A0AAN6I8P9_9EURO|nr:hypothetical protein EDD36DRAFT_483383 [Exophiala viscosa]KAI1628462.1 hypothetical protein EDD37DRAFT_7077 [Exophiala viscosa]